MPGALRSLAPLPVTPPLPIKGANGQLLNDPTNPYLGRYEGDEDTRRKPAYHNGTAWTWMFPSFCEALARAQFQRIAEEHSFYGRLAAEELHLAPALPQPAPEPTATELAEAADNPGLQRALA